MDRALRLVDPVLRVQSQITDRDCILLDRLAEHGVLTSVQIARALFPSLDYAQERLRVLVGLRAASTYNLVEFGPKGTGKSHIFSEFSPHGMLISGGEVTVPSSSSTTPTDASAWSGTGTSSHSTSSLEDPARPRTRRLPAYV